MIASCLRSRKVSDLALLGEQSLTDEETKSQLKAAEKDCLEARATYMLQQSVVEDVLITDPVLKAVHSGANTTSTEM